MTHKGIIIILICLFLAAEMACESPKKDNIQTQPSTKVEKKPENAPPSPKKEYKVGDVVDTYNNVPVYYNGRILNVTERHVAPDGYNIGLKYQCVEFVKRYYYEAYKHKMPDTYGDAKDFFDPKIPDGGLNPKRNLLQFKNYGKYQPLPNDIIVWKGNKSNPYGHVAIVSDTNKYTIEIVQQNPGPNAPSRVELPIVRYEGKWKVCVLDVVGWLRRK